MGNKIRINTVNDGQRDFVFDLMKGCNVSNLFKKSETLDLEIRNSYEKTNCKALDILLEYQKSTEGIKNFFPKRFKKGIN